MPSSKSHSKQAASSQHRHTHKGPPRLEQLCLFLVGLGWTARWLTVTEGVSAGETLWIALLWPVIGTIWCWNQFKIAQQNRFISNPASESTTNGLCRGFKQLDLFNCGVGLIVLGHLAGLVWLFLNGGELRHGVNLCCEWIGLGFTFLILRRLLTHREWRAEFLTLVLACSLPLAMFGIWQHYVWYSAASAEYLSYKTDYDHLHPQSPSSLSSAEQQRLNEVQEYFTQQGIPLESAALESWENRLLSSREPLGFFALTNSFAALLLFTIGGWFSLTREFLRLKTRNDKRPTRRDTLLLIGSLLLLFFCLILTKSRTAWIALLIILPVWSLSLWRTQWIRYILIGGGGSLVLLLVAWFTGGIDQLVFSEAPKSVEYRLSYWHTTGNILAESPLWGTGPGNFRPWYLKFKPAGASEEITDPHQFILDTWANGGLLAFLGLCLLTWAVVRVKFQQVASNSATTNSLEPFQRPANKSTSGASKSEPFLISPIWIGGILAFLGIGAVHWLNFSDLASSLIWTGFGTACLLFILKHYFQPEIDACAAQLPVTGSWVLLIVLLHLSASGGMEMPGIAQIVMLLLAVIAPVHPRINHNISQASLTIPPLLGTLVTASLSGLIFWYAFYPSFQAESFIKLADSAVVQGTAREEVFSLYQLAAKADPLSPLPHQRMGEVGLQACRSQQNWASEAFQAVETSFQQAINRDPHNPRRYWTLAKAYRENFQATQNRDAGDLSVHFYEQAVSLYPTHAGLRAEFAQFLAKRNLTNKAIVQALKGLELDEINKQRGHTEQRLDVDLLKRLKQISDL